jgi:NAD(P)-dependent dehydrogenase (short-subunit alcohol dehydrogenase family)
MATRLALATGANGGIGSAICDHLRENGFEVRTMDAVGPCDVLADLAVDPIIAGGLELNTFSIVGTNRGTPVKPGPLATIDWATGDR